MRLLFISSQEVHSKSNGGYLCTNRNYNSWCKLLGEKNVEVLNVSALYHSNFLNKFKKRFNYLYGFRQGLTKKSLKKILNHANNFDIVFFDDSFYGIIALHLNRSGFSGKIICFFHNVERDILFQIFKSDPTKLAKLLVTYYNEKHAFGHSDIRIALNHRDCKRLQKIYGERTVETIPISLDDTLPYQNKVFTSHPPVCLFFGSSWYANIQGLDWFVENVLPSEDITLQIVGIEANFLKKAYKFNPKIQILGYVNNLSKVLMDADYVILPIFQGGGMKVKTCESLMYGKIILGTTEAFEGYEIDYDEVGALCNSKEEFIEALSKYNKERRNKFNINSRRYFLTNYSFDITLKKFNNLLPTKVKHDTVYI